MKKLVTLAAGLALVVGASTAAEAQCSITAAGACPAHTVSVTAPTILRLTTTTASTALSAPVEANFDNVLGRTDGTTVGITVKSNVLATGQIATGAANWSGPGTTTKAIGDLRWSTTGAAPFTALTGTDAAVVISARGNRSQTITWNTLWNSLTDEPGNYTIPVTFTLTVP